MKSKHYPSLRPADLLLTAATIAQGVQALRAKYKGRGTEIEERQTVAKSDLINREQANGKDDCCDWIRAGTVALEDGNPRSSTESRQREQQGQPKSHWPTE